MMVLFLRHLAAAIHPTTHTTSWRKPKGMFRRIVWRALKPKPWMMRGPKVPVTAAPVLSVSSCNGWRRLVKTIT